MRRTDDVRECSVANARAGNIEHLLGLRTQRLAHALGFLRGDAGQGDDVPFGLLLPPWVNDARAFSASSATLEAAFNRWSHWPIASPTKSLERRLASAGGFGDQRLGLAPASRSESMTRVIAVAAASADSFTLSASRVKPADSCVERAPALAMAASMRRSP